MLSPRIFLGAGGSTVVACGAVFVIVTTGRMWRFMVPSDSVQLGQHTEVAGQEEDLKLVKSVKSQSPFIPDSAELRDWIV